MFCTMVYLAICRSFGDFYECAQRLALPAGITPSQYAVSSHRATGVQEDLDAYGRTSGFEPEALRGVCTGIEFASLGPSKTIWIVTNCQNYRVLRI